MNRLRGSVPPSSPGHSPPERRYSRRATHPPASASSSVTKLTACRYSMLSFAHVVGGLIVVLWRNQQDLHELEAGRVPPEVDRALGDAPPPE